MRMLAHAAVTQDGRAASTRAVGGCSLFVSVPRPRAYRPAWGNVGATNANGVS
jgi:hypothetical protein